MSINPSLTANRLLSVLLLMIVSLAARAELNEKISDMGAALEYCRCSPLDRLEGIWEFPEDNTVVIITRREGRKKGYELRIVDSPDVRLHPGDLLGEMEPTVDSDRFLLRLYGSKKNGIPGQPEECAATFSDKEGTIKVERRKLRLNLNISRFLPKFWRILSIFKVSDPASKLPEGLIRIFPSSEGKEAERELPRYL